MDELSTMKRLELIKQVRSNYNRNRYDLSNREKLLYGRETFHTYDGFAEGAANTDYEEYRSQVRHGSMFRIRLIAGILLFFLLFFMDSGDLTIAGHTADEIFQAISYDYVESFDEILQTFSTDTTQ